MLSRFKLSNSDLYSDLDSEFISTLSKTVYEIIKLQAQVRS